MLNLDQIKQAYELKQNDMTIKEMTEKLNSNVNEITYSLNTYSLLKEDQEKKDKFAISQLDTENLNNEYININKEKEDLELEKKKLLEREAFVKLFTKNIIYKYKSKDLSLEQRYKKLVAQNIKKNMDIVQENFNLYFDLQKEIKEKIDIQQDYSNQKYLLKFKYIFVFLFGFTCSVVSYIIYTNI